MSDAKTAESAEDQKDDCHFESPLPKAEVDQPAATVVSGHEPECVGANRNAEPSATSDQAGSAELETRRERLRGSARVLRRSGRKREEILRLLTIFNAQNKSALPESEVLDVVESVCREPVAAKTDGEKPDASSGLIVRSLATIEPEPITWLWPGRIPLGKLTILCGDPDHFKTGVMLDIAARVSAGRPWPDRRDGENPAGDVLIMTAEDGLADTIRPRLDVAEADVSRIHALDGIGTPQSVEPFYIDDHFHKLDMELAGMHVRLVCIDPLGAFLSAKTDSHKDAPVRSATALLAKLAEKHQCAVVAIMHLNKQYGGTALKRIGGSGAFGAAARAVWFFGKDPDDPDRHLMLCAKLNIAQKPDGLAYTIATAELPGVGRQPCVHWLPEQVQMRADELLANELQKPTARLDEAIEFVRVKLANGPMASSLLSCHAKMADIADKTLERAKKKLEVVSTKPKGRSNAPWMVALPSSPNTIDDGVEEVGEVGGVGAEVRQVPQDRQGRQPIADEGADAEGKPPVSLSGQAKPVEPPKQDRGDPGAKAASGSNL